MGKNEIGTYIILLNMIQYQLEINEHSWYKHLLGPPLIILLDYQSYYKCKNRQGEENVEQWIHRESC
jgi:hypothetical protein